MATVHDVGDYLILRACEADLRINLLKLHKLLYYVQAWHLVHFGKPFFDEKFQAWALGPVSPQLHVRFRDTKSLYSAMATEDIRPEFDSTIFDISQIELMNAVLESYGSLTGDQLETMVHREDPWIEARGSLHPSARSEELISEDTMRAFYAARLSNECNVGEALSRALGVSEEGLGTY